MNLNEGLVSIVTPVFNSGRYIDATILSVLKQSYSHWEIILIDDGSSDDSIEIIENYVRKDSRFKLLKNTVNSGPAISRNRGIEAAKGQFLTFLDADDLWDDHFIEKSVDFMVSNSYDFVFSSYKRVDENLLPLYNDFIVPSKVNYESLLKTCPISCLTAFLNIGSIGKYYMPKIDKRQDYGLWLSILKNIDYAYGIKEPLATYRIRKGSVSRNKFKAMLYVWRVYRTVEKINFFKSTYLLACYTINGLKKYSN